MKCHRCGEEVDPTALGQSWLKVYEGPESPVLRFCPPCTAKLGWKDSSGEQ